MGMNYLSPRWFSERKTENRKYGKTPEKTWEIPKETGETISET